MRDKFAFENLEKFSTQSIARHRSSGSIPEELIRICERAMHRDKLLRYNNTNEMVQEISEWLDGSKKQEQALSVVKEAIELNVKREDLEYEAANLKLVAEGELKKIPLWETEELKSVWWEKEEKASLLLNQATMVDVLQEHLLMAALTHKSDLIEAHIALAERYQMIHKESENNRELLQQIRAETLLREHVHALPQAHPKRINFLEYLDGKGTVTLEIEQDDVGVCLEAYRPHHRRLIPELIADLGNLPIESYLLAMGSYCFRLSKKGFHDVRYPVSIGRLEHWDCQGPDGMKYPIVLPKLEEIDADECFVPSGWFWAGGDPDATRGLPRQRIWLDSFVMKRFPVTNREFLEFLNDLLEQGREEEALRFAPQTLVGQSGEMGAMFYSRDSKSRFVISVDAEGEPWNLDWPVCMVDWYGAISYAKWKSEQTNQTWRLPHELEWAKATRGVDGRFYAWGDGFDASYTCMRQSRPEKVLPSITSEFPLDESVYGIRGLIGNMSDWMSSKWFDDWDDLNQNFYKDLSYVGDAQPTDLMTVRGGGWSDSPQHLRAAQRNAVNPVDRHYTLGFRLVRSFK